MISICDVPGKNNQVADSLYRNHACDHESDQSLSEREYLSLTKIRERASTGDNGENINGEEMANLRLRFEMHGDTNWQLLNKSSNVLQRSLKCATKFLSVECYSDVCDSSLQLISYYNI